MTKGRAGQVLVTAATVALGLVSASPASSKATGPTCSAALRSRAAVATNTQPTWSPDGKWIAYTSDREGAFDVWKTDGTHVRRIVRNATDPAWSPDGRKIAFVATGSAIRPAISVIDASGSGAPRRLTLDAGQPAWSPDGRRIAFTASTGSCAQGFSIWVMNANGSGKFIVAESSDEFTDYGGPAWSPDGKRIAHAVYGDQAQSGIYTVPVTGDEATPQLVVSDGSQASWSPDGQKIAYVFAGRSGHGSLHVIDVRTLRERELSGQRTATPAWSPGGKRIAFSVRATDGSYDVYAVDPDGSHLVRLTRPVRSSGPPSTASDFSDVTNSGPAWSPDGGRLAFVSGRRTPSNRSTATVAVIGVDGKGRRTLTAGGRPMWSPDGGRIAFVESDDAGADIDVIDLDGGNRRRLVRTLRSYPQVDWSPDGTRIAYDESENNQALIYVLNVETGARSLVVSDGYAPDWSADGARIMFQSYDSKENRYYLEVVKSDGTDRHRILAGSEPWEGLRWSPDDRRIAYVSVRGGIWIMNADGSDARRLLDGYGYVPSWSPDGSSIAFEQRLEVMTVPSNGGTPRRVTYGGCTIVGTDGGDLLAGTPNDDVICAFDGKDTITAGAGEDRILGGNGGDRIFGGPGRDRIFGEDGPDAVDGGPGSDSIRTGKGPDVIVADDGEPDAIDGEEGRDCAIADARDHLVAIERRGCPRVR